ncbi:metal ABC transporter solute-binding protein, Zn/Mn family [Nitrosophilus kaiyonis]|uniref:metal ABC transporter solute-binding protein, Zn/Mn family n=1 Tax=Nitrosophilus kaiyonis TaxID=2930200 RepID=UPI002490B467|nr:zinc ABC transporter substrate-binding protein [Nitrosophilus kaiyonis]
MRFFLIFLLFLGSLFAKDMIAVSILPQKFFVKKIVEDRFDIEVMVPPGSSPATYSVKPQQLLSLKKAKIYFSTGVPFEKAWLKRFKSANKSLKIVDIGKYIKKFPMQEHHHEGEHEHHHEHEKILDPHIWLSPPLVILQARVILEEICKIDPKNKDFYLKNYQKFSNELTNLDTKIFKKLFNLKKREFIVYHPSFGYFARSYNLKQIAIEKEGKEPTIKYLKRVIDIAKKKNIKVVFVEPQFSKKSAKFIASKIGGEVLEIDPLNENWDKNILKVVEAIERANSN